MVPIFLGAKPRDSFESQSRQVVDREDVKWNSVVFSAELQNWNVEFK